MQEWVQPLDALQGVPGEAFGVEALVCHPAAQLGDARFVRLSGVGAGPGRAVPSQGAAAVAGAERERGAAGGG
ncbi:hypothetical protein [Streptomyces coeruleorubidus]|uniref:hypothetical protein n=1 Tax=Streptomyces coeruleorubidus TaxID=116188 RepID=UPI0034015E0E